MSGKGKLVAVDTNIFIYYFNNNSPFCSQSERVLKTIVINQTEIVTSILTLAELLSFKATKTELNTLESEFLMIPNLKIVDVNKDVVVRAAEIRRKYGFRLPDAIQLATAIYCKAKVFITNDKRLEVFKELKIVLLNK